MTQWLSYIRILESLEPLYAVLLGAGLFFAGRKASEEQPTLRAWGWTLAGASTIAYVLWALLTRRVDPAVLCVFTVGFGLGLAGVWFIIVALAAGIWRILRSFWAMVTGTMSSWRERWSAWRDRPVRIMQPKPDPASERAAEVERERLKDEQRQREDAMAAPEILLERHAPEIEERYPRARFNEFVKKHFGPERSLSYVLARSKELQDVILQHLGKIELKEPRPPAVERLAARQEFETYYRKHFDLLKVVFPAELFQASLRLEMADDKDPAQCWAACQKLIASLRELVEKESERRRKGEEGQSSRAEQIRTVELQLAERRAELKNVQGNETNAPAEVVENDAGAIEEQIRILEETRKRLQTHEVTDG